MVININVSNKNESKNMKKFFDEKENSTIKKIV